MALGGHYEQSGIRVQVHSNCIIVFHIMRNNACVPWRNTGFVPNAVSRLFILDIAEFNDFVYLVDRINKEAGNQRRMINGEVS